MELPLASSKGFQYSRFEPQIHSPFDTLQISNPNKKLRASSSTKIESIQLDERTSSTKVVGQWSDHGERTGGFYACNRYESAKQEGAYDEPERRREMAKNSLERYTHTPTIMNDGLQTNRRGKGSSGFASDANSSCDAEAGLEKDSSMCKGITYLPQ